MAASEAVSNFQEIDAVPEKDELDKLLANVIHKRKTIPAKCLKICRDIIRYEIKRLENVEIKVESGMERENIIKLVHKLERFIPINITFDDMFEAEEKLTRCCQGFKDINKYLTKRNQHLDQCNI